MMAHWSLSKKKYFYMMMVALDLVYLGARRFAWNTQVTSLSSLAKLHATLLDLHDLRLILEIPNCA
jgi:hypothetical protein